MKKQEQEITIEMLLEKQKELKGQQQETFMNNLLEMVENLCEKANAKGYEPTINEKQAFTKIVNIIDNMKEWF